MLILTFLASLFGAYKLRAINQESQRTAPESKKSEIETDEEIIEREKATEKERVYRVRLTGIPTIMGALTIAFMGLLTVRLIRDDCCGDGQPYCETQVGDEWVPNNVTDTSCCPPITTCITDRDDSNDGKTKKQKKTKTTRTDADR